MNILVINCGTVTRRQYSQRDCASALALMGVCSHTRPQEKTR